MVFALVSCDPPKSSSPKPCTRADRFTLTKKVDNTYTLTICEGVQTIAEGEFSAVESIGSGAKKKDLATRLKDQLGGTPQEAVTAIVLPSTLQTIGDYAFTEHKKVTGTFTVPKQVQSIGEYAFQSLGFSAASLDIAFPTDSQLTVIKENAFNFARTNNLILPKSVEIIEKFAFSQLRGANIDSFKIPQNVKKIGGGAFRKSPVNFSGILTIESTHLVRTPANTTQPRTGTMGVQLFVDQTFGPRPTNFTAIKLPKAVYDSYTAAELNTIFGTGATYQDLDGNDH